MSDVWGGSWIIETPKASPGCDILPDPNSERKCGRPTSGRTALDRPICDECYSFVRVMENPIAA